MTKSWSAEIALYESLCQVCENEGAEALDSRLRLTDTTALEQLHRAWLAHGEVLFSAFCTPTSVKAAVAREVNRRAIMELNGWLQTRGLRGVDER